MDARPRRTVATVTIPASFQFAEEAENADWRNEHEENKIARSDELDTPWAIDPCWPKKTTYKTDTKRTSMLSLTRSGPEYADTLQVALYPEAATAAAVLEQFEHALNRCKAAFTDSEKYTDHRWAVEPLPGFAGGLLGLGSYYVEGRRVPGKEHFVSYQLGNAVFLRLIAGEVGNGGPGESDAREAVLESATVNRVALCRLLQCVETE